MKKRTVMVTLELETKVSVRAIRKLCFWTYEHSPALFAIDDNVDVIQVEANVIKPTKRGKKKP